MPFASSANNAEIWYVDAGPRTADITLIMTHGFNDSHKMWEGVTPTLVTAGYRVISWDMRAHGLSKVMAPNYKQAEVKKQLDALILVDALPENQMYSKSAQLADFEAIYVAAGLHGKVILVGHSMGGFDQMLFYNVYPERVSGMVLYGTGPGFGSEKGVDSWNRTAVKIADKLRKKGKDSLAEFCERSYAQLESDPVSNVIKNWPFTLAKSLNDIKVPCAIIVGEHDKVFQISSKVMARKIPVSKLNEIRGAGHLAITEKPQEFQQILLSSLDWVVKTIKITDSKL